MLGDENIFLFGLKADEVAELKQRGLSVPSDVLYAEPGAEARCIDAAVRRLPATG